MGSAGVPTWFEATSHAALFLLRRLEPGHGGFDRHTFQVVQHLQYRTGAADRHGTEKDRIVRYYKLISTDRFS